MHFPENIQFHWIKSQFGNMALSSKESSLFQEEDKVQKFDSQSNKFFHHKRLTGIKLNIAMEQDMIVEQKAPSSA